MAYSFSVTDLNGDNEVDFNEYGLTVLAHELPWDMEPLTETVNLPGRRGGYTYINEAKPSTITLDVNVAAEDHETLVENMNEIIAALSPLQVFRVYVEGVSQYWEGRRVSGITARLYGADLVAVDFPIVFVCDNPEPKSVED